MNNEITQAEAHSLATMATDDLWSALRDQMEITAVHVQRMAEIWIELERRGEDMSAMRSGIGQYLAAVARGKLLPGVVVRLAGNQIALRGVSTLTLENQRLLLDHGSVRVRRDTDSTVEVPIHRLTAADIHRAVDSVGGEIIPPDQQTLPRVRKRAVMRMGKFSIAVTTVEKGRLFDAAEKAGLPAAEFVRKILKGEGVI